MMDFLERFWGVIRRHPLATGFVIAAVILAVANLQLWKERERAIERHEEVRRRGETMLAALADRARIQADVAALREALEEIDRHVVSEESKEVNLGYFYRLERSNRVRLNRVDQLVVSSGATGAYKPVPVSLRLTGSYRNLLGFVREIETGPRVMRVRQYQLEREGEAKDDDLLLALTLEILARP